MSGIVQYVVIRGDLMKNLQWPVGAVVAQACHACTAVTHLFYNDEYTRAYLDDLDNMHKVVLDAPDEASLKELHEKLDNDNINHRLWIEQPENIPTCLVVKPYPKEQMIFVFHHPYHCRGNNDLLPLRMITREKDFPLNFDVKRCRVMNYKLIG